MIAALAVLLPASAAADPTPEYFPLPEARSIGGGMTVDSSGNVWFAAQGPTTAIAPSLARLTPAALSPGTSAGIEYFPTPEIENEPCCAKFIRDVAFDPINNRVWFVTSTGAIGYGVPSLMAAGTPSGLHVATTPGFPDLGGVAVDPSGVAWFTENSSNNVAPAYAGNRVAHTDGSLAITQYPDLWHQPGHTDESRYGAEPAGVTIGKEGAPWFAEADSGLAGYRLAKAVGGAYQEYLLTPCEPTQPCSGSYTSTGPLSVATAPDGSIWFTNVLKNTFGKLDLQTSTITQYSLPGIDSRLAGGEPRVIRAAPDGTLWLAERGFVSHPLANALVRIVPTDPPTATVYELGSGHAPISLAPDSAGNVWFGVADTTPSAVGRLAGVVGPGLGRRLRRRLDPRRRLVGDDLGRRLVHLDFVPDHAAARQGRRPGRDRRHRQSRRDPRQRRLALGQPGLHRAAVEPVRGGLPARRRRIRDRIPGDEAARVRGQGGRAQGRGRSSSAANRSASPAAARPRS